MLLRPGSKLLENYGPRFQAFVVIKPRSEISHGVVIEGFLDSSVVREGTRNLVHVDGSEVAGFSGVVAGRRERTDPT